MGFLLFYIWFYLPLSFLSEGSLPTPLPSVLVSSKQRLGGLCALQASDMLFRRISALLQYVVANMLAQAKHILST